MSRNLDTRDLGFYFSLAQVGFVMVVPIGIGWWVDSYFQCDPWGVVVGAVLGFVVGLVNLLALLNRYDKADSNKEERDQ